MNRIQEVLTNRKEKNLKSFIGFLTAGDPDISKLEPLLYALEEGGSDVIEIGIPFSDPLADGPVIQAAGQRSIENGTNVYKVFEVLEKCRNKIKVPIAFLVYFNTLTVYGVEAFVQKCVEIGIDGLIIPDLPYEEQAELTQFLDQDKIALIPFATPTSKERMAFTLAEGTGFVYTVSSMGVTGRASDFYSDLDNYIKLVHSYAKIPVAIGFGISTKEDVTKMSKLADAVIVGTAIVKNIHESGGDPVKLKAFIEELVSGL
jgi:tryptophan synthase alpha chain